jgi:hypothetical protein
VTRIDETKIKTVLGIEGHFAFQNYPVEYFAHYSFVSEDFGLRAELSEGCLEYYYKRVYNRQNDLLE